MNLIRDINQKGIQNKPLLVHLKRGSSIESTHIVHAVVCDWKGRILMRAGNSNLETFIRSSLKPFQVLPFISSGTSEMCHCGEKGIAVACGSHTGTAKHAREVFKILWNSKVEVTDLKCPLQSEITSRLEHNCSGKHAAFLATCKKMNWSLDGYLKYDHPLQLEILRRIAELLGIPKEELIAEKDNCGAPTLLMQLAQMALLYAHISKGNHAEFEQINRAMIAYPELVAGEGKFDTEVMTRAHGQIVSKGGSEGVQCIGRIGEGMGLAIKVEDGSKRAKHAAAINLLNQLEWVTPIGLKELEERFLILSPDVLLEVEGQLKFNEY